MTLPLHWKRPARIFVSSTSDIFHENLPDEAIDKIFAVMALAPQHTFQVLTKRAERMRDYFAEGRERMHTRWLWAARSAIQCYKAGAAIPGEFPLPNVWLGVSAERQQEADERIPLLLRTPAAVRFISAEPLIGPVDLDAVRAFRTIWWDTKTPGGRPPVGVGLDWVICGGESGPNRRAMDLAWAYSLLAQCDSAGVSFFMKQIDGRQPIPPDLLVRQFPQAPSTKQAA